MEDEERGNFATDQGLIPQGGAQPRTKEGIVFINSRGEEGSVVTLKENKHNLRKLEISPFFPQPYLTR